MTWIPTSLALKAENATNDQSAQDVDTSLEQLWNQGVDDPAPQKRFKPSSTGIPATTPTPMPVQSKPVIKLGTQKPTPVKTKPDLKLNPPARTETKKTMPVAEPIKPVDNAQKMAPPQKEKIEKNQKTEKKAKLKLAEPVPTTPDKAKPQVKPAPKAIRHAESEKSQGKQSESQKTEPDILENKTSKPAKAELKSKERKPKEPKPLKSKPTEIAQPKADEAAAPQPLSPSLKEAIPPKSKKPKKDKQPSVKPATQTDDTTDKVKISPPAKTKKAPASKPTQAAPELKRDEKSEKPTELEKTPQKPERVKKAKKARPPKQKSKWEPFVDTRPIPTVVPVTTQPAEATPSSTTEVAAPLTLPEEKPKKIKAEKPKKERLPKAPAKADTPKPVKNARPDKKQAAPTPVESDLTPPTSVTPDVATPLAQPETKPQKVKEQKAEKVKVQKPKSEKIKTEKPKTERPPKAAKSKPVKAAKPDKKQTAATPVESNLKPPTNATPDVATPLAQPQAAPNQGPSSPSPADTPAPALPQREQTPTLPLTPKTPEPTKAPEPENLPDDVAKLSGEYLALVKQWQLSKQKESLEPILNKGQEAAVAILKNSESISDTAFSALRKSMPGYLMIRRDIIVVGPDPAFFMTLATQKGKATDIAFFKLMNQTLNGYWPSTMEQLANLSGCTRFGSGELVRLYGEWTAFKKQFPNAYAKALQDPNLLLLNDLEDQLLNSTAACEGPDSVRRELEQFVTAFPKSSLTLRLKQRLLYLQQNKLDMSFNQGVRHQLQESEK